jgi:hypothetical protein
MLLPGNCLVAGGKAGQLFVLDPTTMSSTAGNQLPTPALNVFQATVNTFLPENENPHDGPRCYDKIFAAGPHIHGGPVFYSGTGGDFLFLWGQKDYPKRFAVTAGTVSTTPIKAMPAIAPYENPSDWTRTGTACFNAGTPKPVVLLSDLEGDGRSDFICRVPSTSQNTVSYVRLPGMGQ